MAALLHHEPLQEKLAVVHTVIIHQPSDIFIVLVDLWIGVALMVSNPRRERSAAYTVARAVMPVQVWGVLFTLLAATVLAALLLRKTGRYRAFKRMADFTRLAGPALYTFWGVTFFIAAVTQTSASFVAVGAYLYLAYRHSFCPVPGLS